MQETLEAERSQHRQEIRELQENFDSQVVCIINEVSIGRTEQCPNQQIRRHEMESSLQRCSVLTEFLPR